jgi:hypothetical protein
LFAFSLSQQGPSKREPSWLVEPLRNIRDYELMGRLAEAISRRDPNDARIRRLYAQCLIDTGKPSVAIDVLKPFAQTLPKEHPEHIEVLGLLGRSYKQIFFDAADKSAEFARAALKNAVESHRVPFEEDPAHNTWHGVNLVALVTRMRRLGIQTDPTLQARNIAKTVVEQLDVTPEDCRDDWYLNTFAEASLGLDDWKKAEDYFRQCVTASKVREFHIASLLRQMTEIWDIESLGNTARQSLGYCAQDFWNFRVDGSMFQRQNFTGCAPNPDQTTSSLRHCSGPENFQMVEDRS